MILTKPCIKSSPSSLKFCLETNNFSIIFLDGGILKNLSISNTFINFNDYTPNFHRFLKNNRRWNINKKSIPHSGIFNILNIWFIRYTLKNQIFSVKMFIFELAFSSPSWLKDWFLKVSTKLLSIRGLKNKTLSILQYPDFKSLKSINLLGFVILLSSSLICFLFYTLGWSLCSVHIVNHIRLLFFFYVCS